MLEEITLVPRDPWLNEKASGGSLEFTVSEWIPACRERSRERMDGWSEGGAGGLQRTGLVGDQMSSQWGRNVEVRVEGRRRYKKGGSQQLPCLLQKQCSCC